MRAAHDKRAALTNEQAIEIFGLRLPLGGLAGSSMHCSFTSRSVEISRKFGVSPKAVRDIWNRRTWCRVTSPLFPEADTVQHAVADSLNAVRQAGVLHYAGQARKVGRPIGSKDSKPRRRCRPQHLDENELLKERHGLAPIPQLAMHYTSLLVDQSRYDSGESCIRTAKQENFACETGDDGQDSEEISLLRTYPFYLQV